MLDRLKRLPWQSLFLVAAAATAIATLTEQVLFWAFQEVAIVTQLLSIVLFPPLGTLIPVAVPMGLGVLTVYLLERWQTQVFVNTASLWALVPCLLLSLWLKSLLVPYFLLGLSRTALIGIVLGVFWKGRSYWR